MASFFRILMSNTTANTNSLRCAVLLVLSAWFLYAQVLGPGGGASLLNDSKLHVILCGTGSPLPDPDRAGSCTAIIAAGQLILIDAGPGSWRKAMLSNVPGPALSAAFLTHFHSDHIGDLGEAMTMSWANGRSSPLNVYGPPGVEEVVRGFNQTYSLDKGYRVAHHSPEVVPPSAHDMVAHEIVIKDAQTKMLVFEKNGLKVYAFAVDHRPVIPAYGYRIEYAGRSVVITGDTAACDNVARQAQGADILLHDAMAKTTVSFAAANMENQGQRRTAKMLRDILTYHASTIEAAKAAADAKVDTLVLTHLVPPPANVGGERPFLAGVPEIFSGKVVVAKDGLRFDLDPLPQ